jgi:hypothetical protein
MIRVARTFSLLSESHNVVRPVNGQVFSTIAPFCLYISLLPFLSIGLYIF